MEMLRGYSDIVVTASRRDRMMMAPPPPPPPPPPAPVPVMVAQQEDLGDLKLYRIPEPVTVAALSRKQVAMIDRKGVRFERIYTGVFNGALDGQPVAMPSEPAALVLRTANSESKGLGLPLPAGAVAVFEAAGGTPMLVGESGLKDRAIGEEVELGAGTSPDLRYVTTALPRGKRRAAFTVRVTNARATSETFELPLPFKVKSASMPLVERKGVKTWRVAVPANDAVVLNVTFDVPR
ncbi:hypothetical protein MGWOODY_Smn238 [hydrothermal vent metagenome]|uniref:DUF4139 domain-containing protein n=1 Tax=hydrothermal vent metagenome TaxID=652676 RepID=A0A160THB8_9ZZZZ